MSACANCRLSIKTDDNQLTGLCSPCTKLIKQKHCIELAPIERNDLELILAWRSNPKIYRYFRTQDGPLEWNEHISWFESRASERYDFMIHYEGRRTGVVSIDQDNEVGIYIGDFSVHGQGIASATLKWLCDRFNNRTPLFAEIHKSNTASKHLFQQCGFQQTESDGTWLRYVYDS